MFRRLLVGLAFSFALLLQPGAMAQVEIDVDFVDAQSSEFMQKLGTSTGLFGGENSGRRTIAEFLYLTEKDDSCTSNIADEIELPAFICVFDDPTEEDTQHLYLDSDWGLHFVVLHNGIPVAVLDDAVENSTDNGIADLPDGDYSVFVFHNENPNRDEGNSYRLLAIVTFAIGTEIQS